MISVQANNSQILILNSFNFCMSFINHTFLSVVSEDFKKIISLILVSLIAFLSIVIFCLLTGILYHFIITLFDTSNHTILNEFKLSTTFVFNKIKKPHEDSYLINTVYKILPLITIIGFFTPFWLVSLPLLPIVVFSNKYISNKLNLKMNLWVSIFFIIMAFVLFQLLEYSS